MSILFALLAALGWGSSDFAAGYASRKSSAVSVVILTHLASFIALAVVALDWAPVGTMIGDIVGSVGTDEAIRWAGPGFAGSPTAADIAWGLAAGLGGGFGAMLLFRGLGKGSMAVVAPITATGAASIPVLFGILSGDPITALGVVGITLALVAIVLVSLVGGDEGEADDDAGEITDVDGGLDLPSDAPPAPQDPGTPLTVPAGWSAEYGTPQDAPAPGGQLLAPMVLAPRAPTLATSAAVAPTPSSAAAVPTTSAAVSTPVPPPPPPGPWGAPVASRINLSDGEVRMPIRQMRNAVLALITIAILSAATIASRPIRALLDGEPMTGPVTMTLVFALAIVGLAAFALNSVKSLFEISNLGPKGSASKDAGTASSADRPAPTWKAIVRQPGVTEALFSGVGFGLFFVFIYRASESAGHWPLVSARLVSVVLFALVALGSLTAVLPERGSRRPVILAGLLDAAAAVFFVLSTRAGLLSVGAVLAALYPVATVLLARIFTNERIKKQQMVGLALALLAVALLAI